MLARTWQPGSFEPEAYLTVRRSIRYAATIDLLMSGGHRTVTVDLAEVSCVDQAAVVLFAALQHGLYTHDGELRLTNASTGVRKTLINGQVTYTDDAA